MMQPIYQTTIAAPVECRGQALFTGASVALRLLPAVANSGICFVRSDLPGKPRCPARLEYVRESIRCSLLVNGDACIQTVEHLLAAIYGLGVDNLDIEIEGPEVPIFDGSSAPFVALILQAGIIDLSVLRMEHILQQPVAWSNGKGHIVAIPSTQFQISYTLHYPHSPYIKSQFYSTAITPQIFASEIAKSRTFALYEEIQQLIAKGLLKGGGLEMGVVIQGEKVLNPEGVRFPDEMVRHKILDLIGDLALTGLHWRAHIIAICSGHAVNHAFGKELLKQLQEYTGVV